MLKRSSGKKNDGDLGSLAAEELALQVQQGSKVGFTELVNRFGPRLLGYFRQKINSREDCEDLVQETFVKAYRNIHRYDPARSFDPWLFTIGARLVIDHLRSADRCRKAQISSVQETGSDPYALAAGRDEMASLWSHARRLPLKQQDALWLRYVEEMSIKEIAHVLGLTMVHVKVLLFRARSRLAKKFDTSRRNRSRVGREEPLPGAVPVWRGVER